MTTTPYDAKTDIQAAIEAYYAGDWSLEQLLSLASRQEMHPAEHERLQLIADMTHVMSEQKAPPLSDAELRRKIDKLRRRLAEGPAEADTGGLVLRFPAPLLDARRRALVSLAADPGNADDKADVLLPPLVAACELSQMKAGPVTVRRYLRDVPGEPDSWAVLYAFAPADLVRSASCDQRAMAQVRPGFFEMRVTESDRRRRAKEVMRLTELDVSLVLESEDVLIIPLSQLARTSS